MRYPWGISEQIRTNQLNNWPSPVREALRAAYALEPTLLVDVEEFDRAGSMLTILRTPLGLVNEAMTVVLLGELEPLVARDGVANALEQFRLVLLDAAPEDQASPEVLERVVEIERTRRVLSGDVRGVGPVQNGEVEEVGQLVAERMLEAYSRAIEVVSTREEWELRARREAQGEARLVAVVAAREVARRVGAAV